LLGREPGELLARVTVRDRGRHQFGELGEAVLEILGERRVRRRRRDHPPDPAVDDDRGARNSVEPVLTCLGGHAAWKIGVVLEPCGATGAEDLQGHRGAVEWPARTRAEGVRMLAPNGEDSHHGALVITALIVIAADRRIREVQDLGDLPRDGIEHFRGRRTAGHEGRDPPQRRRLLGKLRRLDTILCMPASELGGRFHFVKLPHNRRCEHEPHAGGAGGR
jgi:hypothetical protein